MNPIDFDKIQSIVDEFSKAGLFNIKIQLELPVQNMYMQFVPNYKEATEPGINLSFQVGIDPQWYDHLSGEYPSLESFYKNYHKILARFTRPKDDKNPITKFMNNITVECVPVPGTGGGTNKES